MAKRNKSKGNYFRAVLIGGFVIGTIIAVQFLIFENGMENSQGVPRAVSYHTHADFKAVLNGEEIDFNKPRYDEVYPYAHLHLSNPDGGKIIHFEGMPNITLGMFFESLGMQFNSTCFVLDDGKGHCNNLDKRIRFFVNGQENFHFDLYWPQDANRILITYGNYTDAEIEEHMNGVTNDSCIYSRKCPERIPLMPIEGDKIKF